MLLTDLLVFACPLPLSSPLISLCLVEQQAVVATRGEDISPEYCALEAKRNAYGDLKKLLVRKKNRRAQGHAPKSPVLRESNSALARPCTQLVSLCLLASVVFRSLARPW